MSLPCSPSPHTHPGQEKHRKLNPGLASMPSWRINRFSHIPFLKFSSSFYAFQMSGSVWNCLPLPGTKIEATALCSLPYHALFLGCHPLNQISVHWVSHTDLGLFWKKGVVRTLVCWKAQDFLRDQAQPSCTPLVTLRTSHQPPLSLTSRTQLGAWMFEIKRSVEMVFWLKSATHASLEE